MTVLDRISAYADDLVALRRDLHANPELDFTEERTSNTVARLLTEWGIEVHCGIGKTGVDAILPLGAALLARMVETRSAG